MPAKDTAIIVRLDQQVQAEFKRVCKQVKGKTMAKVLRQFIRREIAKARRKERDAPKCRRCKRPLWGGECVRCEKIKDSVRDEMWEQKHRRLEHE